ncbi:hypothetical protein Pedsa_1463 [Pseudopedobacter saltans DSM 12145]|uniref:Uncharacterized protein n=1 Tax=Pseudopedobacter saltans (strain ATCC 51119 / DSM 12145 / JCM 21818 / CCUG 39354 / LMG 10337 / NBRC 100064 / NCIMB 13643) TaxID=762903 RepID=F0S579_PSESL|nr:hypothetical protein [Pseudopedobacter saltans]ADY52024.1 hypothetical protein Pedsa_1463 [Pseudopedobacter saltans DSM 12145]
MNPKTAIKIMLGLLVCVILFHLSIILKITPYEITWGGRLKNDTEMYIFEAISLLISLLLFLVLLIKGEYVKDFISTKVVNTILWIFIILFGLNTIGNIVAETILEKSFAVLTLASVILILIILNKGKKRAHSNSNVLKT